MKEYISLFLVLGLLIGSVFVSNYASAEQKYTYRQFGDEQGNQSWSNFLQRLYWFVVVAPSVLLMAVPWILWAFNRMKAEHEEDPQAQYKAKRWFMLAIEVDIALAVVVAGEVFVWFRWLAAGS